MFLSALLLLGMATVSQSATLLGVEPQIINGTDVTTGEIPFQVSLQLRYNNFHFCGGSILNKHYVLTTAQCLSGLFPYDVVVIAGIINLNWSGSRHSAERFIIHREYNPYNSYINDIALIKVQDPFECSYYIGFVTLPEQNEIIAEGAEARVSGYGKTALNRPESKTLKKAMLFISSQERCKAAYRRDKDRDAIYNTHICANNPRRQTGSCIGDAGGPLTVHEKLVGLVSWSMMCALPDFPTVHTRVSSYINWIWENAVD